MKCRVCQKKIPHNWRRCTECENRKVCFLCGDWGAPKASKYCNTCKKTVEAIRQEVKNIKREAKRKRRMEEITKERWQNITLLNV